MTADEIKMVRAMAGQLWVDAEMLCGCAQKESNIDVKRRLYAQANRDKQMASEAAKAIRAGGSE